MTEEPMTWAKIKAAALDGNHPLVNEGERKIKCPRCGQWQSEADYHYSAVMPEYFPYLVPIRQCLKLGCGHFFAVVI